MKGGATLGTFSIRHREGIWNGTFSHFSALGLKHGVSARLGGISNEPFTSLNLALHVGDDPDTVRTNRQLYCQALDIPATALVTAEQIHGDSIHLVTAQDCGRGAANYQDALPQTDALITQVPGIPLMLFFADCVPVLIFDPVQRAIAVVHAGWKGTVALLARKTILAMQRYCQTQPEDCLVGIAPSIGPCCYEVDDPVIERLKASFIHWEPLLEKEETRRKLNLWEANRQQLREIGVKDENIINSQVCTACNSSLFFSYRKGQGKTGRLAAFIML